MSESNLLQPVAAGGESTASEQPVGGTVLQSNLVETTAKALANDLIDGIYPDLISSRDKIEEIERSQQMILESLEHENSRFSENENFKHFEETMTKAKVYHGKLMKIRTDMGYIQEKVAKVMKLTLKMKANKEQQFLSKAEEQQREIERDKELMAKRAEPASAGRSASASTRRASSSTP